MLSYNHQVLNFEIMFEPKWVTITHISFGWTSVEQTQKNFFENFECLPVKTRNLLLNYFKLKSRIWICALQKHRLAWTHLFLRRSAFIVHIGYKSHMIKHISQRRPLDPAISLVGDSERPKFKPRVSTLCPYWARHFILTASWFTQEYKWVV